MSKILIMLVMASALLVLAPMYIVTTIIQSPVIPQQQKFAYAQVASQDNNTASNSSGLLSSVHSDVDSSPIAAVIIISKDMQGNLTYIPSNVTIKVGQEILVINNVTDFQSMTNGMNPEDPLAGKLFNTGPIPPRGFAEYVASNLGPGSYPFYSTNNTSTKGVLIIEPGS